MLFHQVLHAALKFGIMVLRFSNLLSLVYPKIISMEHPVRIEFLQWSSLLVIAPQEALKLCEGLIFLILFFFFFFIAIYSSF